MVVPRRYTCGILVLPSYPYTVHIASSFSPTTTPSSISATLILPCGRLAQSWSLHPHTWPDMLEPRSILTRLAESLRRGDDVPRPTLPPAYTRRIQRLLALVNEIKTNPRQEPRLLCRVLGVSRAMLYKDRQVLAQVGFTFRYDR